MYMLTVAICSPGIHTQDPANAPPYPYLCAVSPVISNGGSFSGPVQVIMFIQYERRVDRKCHALSARSEDNAATGSSWEEGGTER